MKRTILVLFISILTFSCTKDDINISQDLTGVWEQSLVTSTSTDIYRLVFGPDHTGLKINTIIYNSGEQTSSSDAFTWLINSNTITITNNKKTEDIYLISSEGNIYLSVEDNLQLNKISDDYSKYY
jgi:hypothetical protein